MKYKLLFLSMIASVLMISACSTSEKTTDRQSQEEIMQMIEELGLQSADTENRNSGNFEPRNSSLELSNYLMRVPGVQVVKAGGETQVHIRGVHSIEGNNFPLFVVNGSQLGHSYSSAAQSVDVEDIEFVSVLRGNEATQRYGSRGTAGVIEIVTK